MQTKIDANHIEGKNDENTRIDQLSNKIVEKFKKILNRQISKAFGMHLKKLKLSGKSHMHGSRLTKLKQDILTP